MTEPSDSTRVGTEEAVAHRLQELAASVAELRGEVRRAVGASLPRDEAAGWDDGERPPPSHAWVSSLGPPRHAPVRIPRLPLELAFVAAAAALAGVADLRPVEIAAVMGAAWVIVALAEWAGSRGDRMRAQVYLSPIAPPPPAAAEPVRADPTWFTPPVEHTLLAPSDDQSTAVATLPPADDPETTAERRPAQ
jgi:hypothetical protein